jgi:hypothetical protein
MKFTPVFFNRDFSNRVNLPSSINARATAMTWAAMGGCYDATITAALRTGKGKPDPLFEFANMLRCPVILQN